ncbi:MULTISPECIES: hypothetical protein [Paenarthrobacter]|uniref:hypothetical protein n=1 Tax=Paenarthrobacter TaxID=1742992 RepID=UPI00074D3484|nr:hypothetical protein [Paenarthrobacter ureafaciens]AMB40245.1 hypothetical protein AUT26_08495 [Arthrobacter sp. ATCC 21022]KUR63458.1 hypothetical protein JM67_17095 [Arthrobacter sp. ATCC 21022]RWW91408.1 hypothetical protein AUR_20045 [Paenarthrobacter ureafaciens]
MEKASTTEARSRQNWSGLRPTRNVLVQESVGEPYQATVDAITEDFTVIWVVSDTTHQRKAFDHREGVVISGA